MTWRTQKKGETGRVIHDRLFYFPKEEFYSLLHSTEFMWWKECCEGGREQLSPSFKGHKKKEKPFGKETNRGLWREQVLGLQGLFRESNSRGYIELYSPGCQKREHRRGVKQKIVGRWIVRRRVTPQHRCHLNCNIAHMSTRAKWMRSGPTFCLLPFRVNCIKPPYNRERLEMFFKSTTGSFSCVCQLRRSHSHAARKVDVIRLTFICCRVLRVVSPAVRINSSIYSSYRLPPSAGALLLI